VTRILDRVQQGDAKAADELLPLVYEELRKTGRGEDGANKRRARPCRRPRWSMKPTSASPVARAINGRGRAHFFRAAAEAMRCILIENARRKSRWKRGGPARAGGVGGIGTGR